jgi:hypothetical protein
VQNQIRFDREKPGAGDGKDGNREKESWQETRAAHWKATATARNPARQFDHRPRTEIDSQLRKE